MLRARRRTFIRPPFIPPLIVMGTAALISLAAAQLAIAAPVYRTSVASDCSSPGAAARAQSRHAGSAPALAQRFDSRGEFTGRSLSVAGRPSAILLPAESFVGQPVGDALVYTLSAGGKSEVHLVDLGSGCDAIVAKPAGVTRSAVLDPAGGALYVHGVTYSARADAGVMRYALDGSAGVPVVPPLPDDDRFGLTFGTQLGWSTDGSVLSVQSCGIASCRTRLLTVGTGLIATFDHDGQGPIVGVTQQHLITFGECDGMPCPVLSTDFDDGSVRTLADAAWAATLDGNSVRISTSAGIVEVDQ